MQLVLLHGGPGVGKMTVGRELAAITGFPLFHNHLTIDMVSAVFGSGSRAFVQMRDQTYLAILHKAASEGLRGVIFTLVFDSTLPGNFYDRIVEAVGPESTVHAVELRCDDAEHLERIVDPSRRAWGKPMNQEGLRRYLDDGGYSPPRGIKDNFILDITHVPPAEAAGIIAGRLPAEPRPSSYQVEQSRSTL